MAHVNYTDRSCVSKAAVLPIVCLELTTTSGSCLLWPHSAAAPPESCPARPEEVVPVPDSPAGCSRISSMRSSRDVGRRGFSYLQRRGRVADLRRRQWPFSSSSSSMSLKIVPQRLCSLSTNQSVNHFVWGKDKTAGIVVKYRLKVLSQCRVRPVRRGRRAAPQCNAIHMTTHPVRVKSATQRNAQNRVWKNL